MRPRERAELADPARLARLANGTGSTPRVLREAMREMFGRHLDLLERILTNEKLEVDSRLRAFEIIAKYGLGTNLNHSAGDDPNMVPGVIALPALQLASLQRELPQAGRDVPAAALSPADEVFPDAAVSRAERPGREQPEPERPVGGRDDAAAA